MKKIICAVLLCCLLAAGCAAIPDTETTQTCTPETSDLPSEFSPDTSPSSAQTSPKPSVSEKPAASSESTSQVSESSELKLAKKTIRNILNQPLTNNSVQLTVEWCSQYPELPTGCEAAALTSALNYWGCEVSKTDIADRYLVYGDSFVTSYLGDPHETDGAGVYPPGLVKTAENYAKANKPSLAALDLTGTSLSDLLKLIEHGCPVILWGTLRMEHPWFEESIYEEYNGVRYPWFENEHCILVIGFNRSNGTVTVSDSLYGQIDYSLSLFSEIYDEIGQFSMVVYDTAQSLDLITEKKESSSPASSSLPVSIPSASSSQESSSPFDGSKPSKNPHSSGSSEVSVPKEYSVSPRLPDTVSSEPSEKEYSFVSKPILY